MVWGHKEDCNKNICDILKYFSLHSEGRPWGIVRDNNAGNNKMGRLMSTVISDLILNSCIMVN